MAGLPPYQFLPPGHPMWAQAMMAQQQAQLAAQAQAQAVAQAQAGHLQNSLRECIQRFSQTILTPHRCSFQVFTH